MSNLVVDSYLSIIDRMDLDSKLALLAGLTESIRTSVRKPESDKQKLLYELFGAWEDVDEGLVDEIYSLREIPDDDISFDMK